MLGGNSPRYDVRLIPAKYVKPFLKGHKNDYRDAEAIAEAVLVGQRTAVINQIRGFLLEHGITIRQGPAGLRQALPAILVQRTGELSPLLLRLLEDRVDDWRQLDGRIGEVTTQIETLAKQDENCKRLMGTPGVGPLIASAMVAAIGDGAAFIKGRDFALGQVWCRNKFPPATGQSSAASAGVAIDIFAPCSFKGPVPFFSGPKAGRNMASLAGLRMRRGDYTKMYSP